MKQFYRLGWMLFAFFVLMGCEKDTTTTPTEPQPLERPVLTLAECTENSFNVTWSAVEHAASYAYRVELEDKTIIAENELPNSGNTLTLPVNDLTPETTYKVFVTANPAEEDAALYTPSETAELAVTTKAKQEEPELPADMFEIQLGITSVAGIQYTFKPKDQLMLYTNILIDERYLTEDGLTDEDFSN